MAADTRDAPGKAPPKGFSLRSRLLGIPAGSKPGQDPLIAALQPRDPEPKPEPEPQQTQASQTPTAEAPQAAPPTAEAETPAHVQPHAHDDDESDEDSQPRVGIALTPRRTSLLSVAFGLNDKKAPKPEKPAEPEPPFVEEA